MTLKGVKPGDKLIPVDTAQWERLVEVTRVTARQAIVIEGHLAFWIASGLRTNVELPYEVRFATPEEIEQHAQSERRLELMHRLSSTTWYHLPLETLEQVYRLVKPAETPENYGTESTNPGPTA